MQTKDPISELIMFMENKEKSITYLTGNPLNIGDMIDRAQLHKA
jgi:hypothetical protein